MGCIHTLLISIVFTLTIDAEDTEKPLPKAMEPIIAELNSAKADATNNHRVQFPWDLG